MNLIDYVTAKDLLAKAYHEDMEKHTKESAERLAQAKEQYKNKLIKSIFSK